MTAFAIFRLRTPNLCFLHTRVVYSMGQTRVLIGEVSRPKVQNRNFYPYKSQKTHPKNAGKTQKTPIFETNFQTIPLSVFKV